MNAPLAAVDDRVIEIDGVCHRVLGRCADRPAMRLAAPDGSLREMSQTEFHAHVARGDVRRAGPAAADAPSGRIPTEAERREQALRSDCLRWFDELRQAGLSASACVHEIAARIAATPAHAGCRTRAPSLRTLQHWRKAREERGAAALLPATHRCGNRLVRISAEFEDCVLEAVETGYARSDRMRLSDLVTLARKSYLDRCAEAGRTPGPCGRDAVRRILADLPHDELLRARLGRAAARPRTLNAVRHHAIEAPLDRVEIDCTIADVHLVDRHGQPVGRPTVCAAIDAATGMILALEATLDAPSEALVVRALRTLLGPVPESFFERHGIETRIQTMGRPKTIVVDQGSENSGPHLQSVIRNAALEFAKAIPGHPEKKPFVERFFRSLNSFCRRMPGASATAELPGRTRTDIALREACLTLEEFDSRLQRWRFDVYGRTPRRRIASPVGPNLSPIACWQDVAARTYLPEPPTA